MISNVSASSASAISESVQTKKPAPPPPAAGKEDSVHLSPQAQAAALRDVDHDGDSK